MTTTALRPRLRASSIAALASVPLLVLGLAACSPAKDGSGSTVKSESQIESDALAWDVAYAQCLRGQGIDAPDPSSDGNRQALKVDDADALERASGTCSTKVTGELGPRPVSAFEKKAQQEGRDEMRKTSECLREKGYDVSDPTDGSYILDGLENVPDEALEACGVAGGGAAVTVEK